VPYFTKHYQQYT